MTTTVSTASHAAVTASTPSRWVLFGLLNLVITAVISLATWYLLAAPGISPWNLYPLPLNAALFWTILAVVFVGFCGEFWGFDRLRQPIRGIAVTAVTITVGIAITWVLGLGAGALYPDFAGDRAGGLGWFTGAMFVLFGFGTYVMVVLNWKHWPWTALRLRQPLVGLCEIAFVAIPTSILYFAIGLPSVALGVTHPPMSNDVVLGWFYSIIVVVILTGQTLDNWPWEQFGGGLRTALASTIGNAVIGTALYFVALPFVEVLLGQQTVHALGNAIHQYPAQLGVCWAFWMIFWGNAFGNKPTELAPWRNRLARTLITFGLAVATFVVYYRFLAGGVLGEPAAAPGISGNALGFMDWAVVCTLFYVVAFESYGIRRFAPR